MNTFEWNDAAFKKALKEYCNLKKNADPAKELRRRAKNIGMRLARMYKDKGVVLTDITAKVHSLGSRVKIRDKIRSKKITFKEKIQREINARKSAKGFTATGWFPAIEALGGSPRDKDNRTGPRRGKLEENLTGNNKSETLVNQQPGAGHVASKVVNLSQQALDQETADMVTYIVRKQSEAARRNGL